MNPKKKMAEDVESVLVNLREQIDSLQAKVDELCKSSGCFKTLEPGKPYKNKK